MPDVLAVVIFLALLGLSAGLILLCDRLGPRP